MSQARVTDFFSQRKKGIAGPVKAAKPRGARTRSAKNKDAFLRSSSVHEEFLRVIDEAAGCPRDGGDTTTTTTTTGGGHVAATETPSSPRTPKRTSADAEFDLGAAVFSATADHSTAKKRRQAEAAAAAASAAVPEKTKRRTAARKKLDLPQETVSRDGEAANRPLTPEVTQTPAAAEAAAAAAAAAPVSEPNAEIQAVSSNKTVGQISKALSKDDIAALKSRLQRIKKHAEGITRASPSPAPDNTRPSVTKTSAPPTSEAKSLKLTAARAKQLAAKAQRRIEEKAAEESRQSETQAQESAELPAYQRYHTLAQAAPPGLSLPYHYKLLAEMFRSMDTVVAMLHNRCETATFAKVKRGVQDMMHKRFEENHASQIKTVFPEAYRFRQEKNVPTFNSSIKRGSYQLTVEPVILSDQNEARPVLSASRLLERRHIFHWNLVDIVKQHHKDFLSALVPPVSVPEDKLTRWHPRFNVDTVPALQTSSLPQPPHTEKLSTAQEVLDKARSFITPKMEKALVSLTLKTEEKAQESKEPTPAQNPAAPQTPAPSAPSAPALKGVSQSLLERIRAKEAQKLQATMTRNPTQEERLLMMSRLGELARILRSVFVAEKKPALVMEAACNRMVASYRSALSTGEMEKHLRLLAEVASDWLTIHPVRKDFYLKLNRNTEISTVLDKLSRRLKEEERL